jgi:sugar lactone lactonase YvrE
VSARPRIARIAVLLAAAAVLAAIFGSAPASAAFRHPAITESFGSDGTEATSIPGATQLSFDQTTRRLYVLDTSTPAIAGFAVAGPTTHTPLAGFPFAVPGPGGVPGLAADDAEGHIYLQSESSGLYGYDSSGQLLGPNFPVTGFADGCGDALDSEGNIWVAEYGAQAVTGFTPLGTPLGKKINVAAAGQPCHIEFDRSNDDLYMVAYSGGVYRFDAAEGYAKAHLVDPENASAVTFDQVSHTLYVAHSGYIAAYDAQGGLLEKFGSTGSHSYQGVAVDDQTGVVYASDQGEIRVMPGSIVPDVTTGEPSANEEVSGVVDPAGGGTVTSCEVEFGPDALYGQSVACSPPAPFTSTQTIHAVLTGLTAEQTYHYRVVAGNANGTNAGLDRTITPHFVNYLRTQPATEITRNCARLVGAYLGQGEATKYHFDYGTEAGHLDTPTPTETEPAQNAPVTVSHELCELSPGVTYRYRVVAENGKGQSVAQEQTFSTVTAVEGLTTEPASEVEATSVTLKASFLGNGEDTHYYFEWGPTTSYGNFTAPPPGRDLGAVTGPTTLSYELTGLTPVTTYHYRVVAENAVGKTAGQDVAVKTATTAPLVRQFTSEVHSDGAVLNAEISPGGLATEYHFEYGPSPCSAGGCTSIPATDVPIGSGGAFVSVHAPATGLQPATNYYFRTVAVNGSGTTATETVFSTFRSTPKIDDACPNALARQQSGAALLLDCRAYELVSAGDTGGYDVESDLVSGQTPYAGFAAASGAGASRVLYGIHQGGIPGTANPTDTGVDPYVATRGEGGWTTAYVGIPANNPYAGGPFSSEPTGIASHLDAFAFGDEGSCSPCFPGGYTGIPVRLADGELVQGMVPAGGVPAPGPSVKADGYIAADLSADGSHLVFGSTARFATGGNDGTGDVSIYDRSLVTGETHVVSNAPGGGPLACLQGAGTCHGPGDANGISELAISADGSRILLGQKVSTDADGNVYWHLYMDVGDAAQSIDLTPGAADGALFDGMTADGSRVFFTTVDALSGADTDTSADVYRADVGAGAATIASLSTASGSGSSDACEPVPGGGRAHWNVVEATEDCSAVAIGGGVGSGSGSTYFLSPERLVPGQGVVDQPNLYLARPGAAPRFVATMSPDDLAVEASVTAAEVPDTADFQVTGNGRYAAFPSALALTGDGSSGLAEVYRYDAEASQLACASCSPTRSATTHAAALASDGSSLSEAGQVFFDSEEALTLRDTDRTGDVYEWEPGGTGGCGPSDPNYSDPTGSCLALISAGSGINASSLLGASADGTDAFIFTHDSLAPQDRNGPLVKIYDARVNGGFFDVPAPPPCAASDECHGAGSQSPGPPSITTTTGRPGNLAAKEHKKKHHKKKSHEKKKHHHKKAHKHRGGKAQKSKKGRQHG